MRFTATVLSAVLPLGALCSPLMHAHPDDGHDGHHGVVRVHAHLNGHDSSSHHVPDQFRDRHLGDHHDAGDLRSSTPELEDEAEPESVAGVQYFLAVQADDVIPVGLQPLGVAIPLPLESVMRRPPVVSHAHDPPDRITSSPRAPPARLV